MIAEYAALTLNTALIYAVIGCAFYYASIALRHVDFAVAIPITLVPASIAIAVPHALGGAAAVATVVGAVALGYGAHSASHALYATGARDGHLMVLSLAVLAIAENVARLMFGDVSVSLESSETVTTFGGVVLPNDHVVTSAVLMMLLLCLGGVARSSHGVSLRAVAASRDLAMLAGVRVYRVELAASICAFTLAAIGGVAWATVWRVRPGTAFVAALVGVVACVVGRTAGFRIAGVIVAASALACTRLVLLLSFESDWTMTALVGVLLTTVAIGRTVSRRVEA